MQETWAFQFCWYETHILEDQLILICPLTVLKFHIWVDAVFQRGFRVIMVGTLLILSMLALMRSDLCLEGLPLWSDQPLGVDQGVKILDRAATTKNPTNTFESPKESTVLISFCFSFGQFPVYVSNMPPCHSGVTRKFMTSSFAINTRQKKLTGKNCIKM